MANAVRHFSPQRNRAGGERGSRRGVDGFICSYFYRHNCLCEHCQREFRKYLRARFTPTDQLDRFGISDLESHKFGEIVSWHPAARAVIVRYYQFLRQNSGIYRGNRSASELALLFQRRAIHQGNAAAVQGFRQVGRALLEAHVLFDVWPDDEFENGSPTAVPTGFAPTYRTVVRMVSE